MRRDGKKENPALIRCLAMLLRHDSSRFESDGKIGMRRDGKKRKSSIDTVSRDALTLRFTTVELRMYENIRVPPPPSGRQFAKL